MSPAALESIEVEGYKSIRSAKIELRAINVLIGANGAGKSNLVSAFALVAAILDRRLQIYVGQRGGANAILHFGAKRTPSMMVRARFGAEGYEVRLGATSDDRLVFEAEIPIYRSGSDPVGSGHRETMVVEEASFDPDDAAFEETRQLVHYISGWRSFHFHDTGLLSPLKLKHNVHDNRSLRAEGDNIAPFLLALRQRANGAYRRIVEAVRSVAPFFDDFDLAPDVVNPDVVQLTWRHKTDDSLFTADSLSDGTLRFICLATLLLQPELPSLIVIDEPELGLHPFAISKLAAMVRAAATKTQVILATQSVTLLDQFEPVDVIVAERENGESTFRRLDEDKLKEWLADYSLGDLWLKNVLNAVRPDP